MSGDAAILGPYIIHERLGAGGMATVHRAEQVGVAGFRKTVALKRLLPHVAADPAMVKSFIHEARLASLLKHTNVAQTLDLGKVDGTYFIAMEYVAGPTLTQLMKKCSGAAGSMPVPIVLSILGQVCDALDHAHNLTDDAGARLNIIHRDVSPSNIIVSNTGIVKLIDFGIAKAANSGGVKTQTGMIKGKYSYLAPEYTLGQLDHRADLFQVGIIAHEMLTTRRLFDAATDFETIKALRQMPIQPPSRWNTAVSRDLDDIVMTALQRDPDVRWQTASAMRTAITNVARSTGSLASYQQVLEWVDWVFGTRQSDGIAKAIGSLGDIASTSGSAELTTNQAIELEALGAVAEASGPTRALDPKLPAASFSVDATLDRTGFAEDKATVARRDMYPPAGANDFSEHEKQTVVAEQAYVDKPSPHVIRRGGSSASDVLERETINAGRESTAAMRPSRPSQPQPIEPRPQRPSQPQPIEPRPQRPSQPHAATHRPSQPQPAEPRPQRPSQPQAKEPPRTTLPSMVPPVPIQRPSDLSAPPPPEARMTLASMAPPPPDLVRSGRSSQPPPRSSRPSQQPSQQPPVRSPFDEESGLLIAPPKPVKKRRRWPWVLLVLVLAGAGVAAYLYFVEDYELAYELDL